MSQQIDSEQEYSKQHRRPGLFWPLLLVAIGVVFLLSNLGLWRGNAWELLATWWPLIFIIGALDDVLRGKNWAGAVVIVALGGVLLLGNLGYLRWTALGLLARLWPAFLLAAGLDLLFSRSLSLWMRLAGVGVALLIVAGLALAAFGLEGRAMEQRSFSQPLLGAKSAVIELNMAVGPVYVSAGAEDEPLLSGRYALGRGETWNETRTDRDGMAYYTLNNEKTTVNVLPGGFNQQPRLELLLSPALPLELKLNFALQEGELDLRGLQVRQLALNQAIGSLRLILPDAPLQGEVDSAIGRLELDLPEDASVRIRYDGLPIVILPEGYQRQGNIIRSGSGTPQIDLTISQAIGILVIR
jgi:hypothetical protein